MVLDRDPPVENTIHGWIRARLVSGTMKQQVSTRRDFHRSLPTVESVDDEYRIRS